MLKSIRSVPRFVALCALVAVPLSCGGPDEVMLEVDERGVWQMTMQDVAGETGLQNLDGSRLDGKYLLMFTRTSENLESQNVQGEVIAATCIDNDGITSSPDESSPCNQGFRCDCYNYSYGGSIMNWAWVSSTIDRPEPDTGETDGGGNPDESAVSVGAFGEAAQTYQFANLPLGLFGCLNESCKYTFQGGFAESKFNATMCQDACQAPEE